jgi:hypothetical protein
MSEQSTEQPASDEDSEEHREDPVVPEEDKTVIDKAAEKVNTILKDNDSSGAP